MSDYILIDGTLYHHGIKGQKWGQRNYQNPDGSYTAKGQAENNGHGRYSDTQAKEDNSNDYKATKKDLNFVVNKNRMNIGMKYIKHRANEIINSKEFKIAVAVGISVAALYALKRVSTKNLYDIAITENASIDELNKWGERTDGFSSLDSIPKALENYHDEYFNEGRIDKLLYHNNYYDTNVLVDNMQNPFKALKLAIEDPDAFDQMNQRSNNCMLCTNSLIMRLKGYDCIAQETTEGTGWTLGMIHEWFEGAKIEAPGKFTRSGLVKELEKQGPGAYGNFLCYWKQGGGHSILYTVREDGVHFIDGQIGKEYSYNELFSKLYPENCRFARLDNCDVKSNILKAIEPYSSNAEDLINYRK